MLTQEHWLSMREIFGDPDAGMPSGPNPEADAQYARGVTLLESGDVAAAEKAFQRADELGHAGAPRELSHWAMARDEGEQWPALLWRARERGDGRAAAIIGAGIPNEPELALELLRFADEAGDCEGSRSLGLMLKASGDYDGAEKAFDRSDQRGSASGSLALGLFFRDERGDLVDAEAAFNRADRRGHPKGALNLIDIYVERGDLAAADGARERVLALAAKHATLFGEMQDPDFERYVRGKGTLPAAAAAGSGCLVALVPVALVAALALLALLIVS
jgi:TPR repeat protein